MKRTYGLAAALAFAAISSASASGQTIVIADAPVNEAAAKRVKKRVAAGSLAKFRRSKNPPTKRKLKSNRLHISRQVRRKHRRAA
jgi:hypothetical protein